MTALTEGRWRDILSTLGIDRKFLLNKNAPCPMCGGKDRWRFDDREGRGTFFCSHCGAGDGFGLVKAYFKCDFREAARMVESVVGSAEIRPPKDRICEDEARAKANRMWAECAPPGPILNAYLVSRHVETRPWNDLRYHAALPYERDNSCWPAMVALVRDSSGKPATLHRTYLRKDGLGKAPVETPRKTSHGLSLPKGAAIRLCPVEKAMGVGEGIETCMAATMLFGVPIWSLLNEGNLASWEPPEGVETLTIFGDNDRNFVGQCAAYTLAKRLSLRQKPISVSVKIPPIIGDDWADVLAAS